MRLIGVGDNVVDYYRDRGLMFPGGNAVNVAVLCHRLGAADCSYMGILGTDSAGEHVVQSLRQEGIDISRIRRAVGENGEAVVALDDEGDRVFVGGNKGGVQYLLKLSLTGDDVSYIQKHDILHTSVYSNLEDELAKVNIPISFDFSTSRGSSYLEKVCPFLTYAFFSGSDLSLEECRSLTEYVHGCGVKIVGVTRGSQGALFSRNGVYYHQGIVPAAEVVDTLGAGDAFIAGFLTHFHDNGGMEQALAYAAQSAARTCGYYGAFGYGAPKPTVGEELRNVVSQ